MKPFIALVLVLTAANVIAESPDASLPFAFPAPPSAQEMLPRNAEENDSGVIVLFRRVELTSDTAHFNSAADLVSEHHRVRFLVRDQSGVESLSQYTFFGDESDVIVGNIAGRTISPDGSVHPVDPDKDIRQLDIESGSGEKDLLRSVSFPRIEVGAILDLAWNSTARNSPGWESVSMEYGFPVRRMEVKIQGQLIGAGKALLRGDGPYFWVPFFFARAPNNAVARLTNKFDLELTATDLPQYRSEPFSPPALRTRTTLGLLPMTFKRRDWAKHVHLFGPETSIPPYQGSKEIWAEGPVSRDSGIAQIDKFGLQVPDLTEEDFPSLKFYLHRLKFFSRKYATFIKRSKSGESPQELALIAPTELSWDERVDRIFAYARDTIQLDSAAKELRKLDKVKKAGVGNSEALLFYTKYLLGQAGIEARLVKVMTRHGPPFIPMFKSFRLFPGPVFVQARSTTGEVRYLEPDDPLADAYSFADAYLGSLMFIESGDDSERWNVSRTDIDTPIRELRELTYTAALPVGENSTTLALKTRNSWSAAAALRWLIGFPKEEDDLEAFEKEQHSRIRAWVESWTGILVDDDAVFDLPDPREDVLEPLEFELELPWSPTIQLLGTQLILPSFPVAEILQNQFVAEERDHAIWLPGGDFTLSMHWQLQNNMHPAELPASEHSGPGGLHYKIDRQWDKETRLLTSKLTMHQPYMLSADAYESTKAFFENLQRDCDSPLLISVAD